MIFTSKNGSQNYSHPQKEETVVFLNEILISNLTLQPSFADCFYTNRQAQKLQLQITHWNRPMAWSPL